MSPASFAVSIPIIETARLMLRQPNVDDFEGYASIVCSERGRFIGGPFDRETAWLDFSQMVAGWVLRGFGALTIASKDGGEYVGTVLVHHEFGDPEPELGWLLTASSEGQGYAFEAAEAMLDWAFEAAKLRTLASFMDPHNHRAVALARRLGGTPVDGPADVVSYRYDLSSRRASSPRSTRRDEGI